MQKKIYFSCTYRKKAVPLHAFSQQMTNVHTALADRSRLCRDKKCQMSNDKCQMLRGYLVLTAGRMVV